MYEVQGTLTCPPHPTPPHPTIAIFKNVRFTGTVFGPQAKRWTLRKSSGWRMKYMLFVKSYFLKPDKSARDKDASGMNRCKSSCTKIYCLVQTIPTKCACHGLCHHPVSMVLPASMTHQQVSHQHLDLTGGLKRSQHIYFIMVWSRPFLWFKTKGIWNHPPGMVKSIHQSDKYSIKDRNSH